MDSNENVAEFLTGQQFATVTFSSRKHINRIKKLYGDDDWKKEFADFYENDDGSIYAKIPVKWIKINPGNKATKVLTEEEKDILRERVRKAREVQSRKRQNPET